MNDQARVSLIYTTKPGFFSELWWPHKHYEIIWTIMWDFIHKIVQEKLGRRIFQTRFDGNIIDSAVCY